MDSPALRNYVARRRKKRDAYWPNADAIVFDPSSGGWTRMPRTVPMIAGLIDVLSAKEKPGRLYTVLWGYEFGDGYVEITDPAHLALEAGYLTPRAERTFNERMKVLAELKFIIPQRIGSREFGALLLPNPHDVVRNLRHDQANSSRIPESWWSAFRARCADIGIDLEGKALPTLTRRLSATRGDLTAAELRRLPPSASHGPARPLVAVQAHKAESTPGDSTGVSHLEDDDAPF